MTQVQMDSMVLSVTILETTKTVAVKGAPDQLFYRSQFWRLQKQSASTSASQSGFIGHNFGDYKNAQTKRLFKLRVLSVTILETTKTDQGKIAEEGTFYRSQFWRLQKPQMVSANDTMKVRSYSESPHFTK